MDWSEYPDTTIQTIALGHWHRPRAKVTGFVRLFRHEQDGDIHIRIAPSMKPIESMFVVCEIIPELPLPEAMHLQRGDQIDAWGIVRYDGEHHWWELHPLIGWRLV